MRSGATPARDAARRRRPRQSRPAARRARCAARAARPTTRRSRPGRARLPVPHSLGPPVQPRLRVDLLVAALVGREPNRLLIAEAESAKAVEALVEEAVHAILQRAVEVNEYVAAENYVEFVEASVLREVVVRPYHVLLEPCVEQGAAVGRDVVLRECLLSTRADVVVGVLLHPVERVDRRARLVEHDLVDVGRVDARSV